MLEQFVYDNETPGNHRYQAPKGCTLRRKKPQPPMNPTQTNSAKLKKERRDAASVRHLEKDMDTMMDDQLLLDAQRDQQSKSMSLSAVMVRVNSMQIVTHGHSAWIELSRDTPTETSTVSVVNNAGQHRRRVVEAWR
jgi:hypothetical protein